MTCTKRAFDQQVRNSDLINLCIDPEAYYELYVNKQRETESFITSPVKSL